MEAVVSDILRSRARESASLSYTTGVSLAVHAVAIVLIAAIPARWSARPEPKRAVMTISLGGSPGPKSGGMTMIGGRAIQAAPPAAAPKIDKVAMPTPKTSTAMTMPVPDPKVKPRPEPKTNAASKDPSGQATGRGAETQKGSTTVETGAKGMGFGLSTGGGGGTGSRLDVQNFCCPEYLNDMVERIRSHWVQQQQAVGSNMMKFTILRSGEIKEIEREQSSNVVSLDLASERALYLTAKLQPLPSAFPDDHLTVHLKFEYTRQ
jgi:outer membrane biosynthesis protein TonB